MGKDIKEHLLNLLEMVKSEKYEVRIDYRLSLLEIIDKYCKGENIQDNCVITVSSTVGEMKITYEIDNSLMTSFEYKAGDAEEQYNEISLGFPYIYDLIESDKYEIEECYLFDWKTRLEIMCEEIEIKTIASNLLFTSEDYTEQDLWKWLLPKKCLKENIKWSDFNDYEYEDEYCNDYFERGSEITAYFDGLGILIKVQKHEIMDVYEYQYRFSYSKLIKVNLELAKKLFNKYLNAIKSCDLGLIGEHEKWSLLFDSDENLRVLLEAKGYEKQLAFGCEKIAEFAYGYVMGIAEYLYYFREKETFFQIIHILLFSADFGDKTLLLRLLEHRIILHAYIAVCWKYGKEKTVSMLIALIKSEYYDPKRYFFIDYVNEEGTKYVEIMYEVCQYFEKNDQRKYQIVYGLLKPQIQAGINLLKA